MSAAENHGPGLVDTFQQYFSVNLANSRERMDAVHRIRFRVYCDEFDYEPADAFPDQLERDAFDPQSLHCVITHKSSAMPAGCVRLVTTTGEGGGEPLPFEKHCPDTLDRGFIKQLGLDRTNVCEISRLAVDGAFRRRSGEVVTRFGEIEALDCSKQEQRAFSMIAVAGFLGATALTELTGRTDVFAMMEPFLPRLLARSGIEFARAGEDIDYHGVRAPYFIRTQSALDGMRADLRELYQAIYKSVAADFSDD